MEATKNLVSALASGNADAIETSFNAAMAEKIAARLDDMRIDMAKSMFTTPVVEESFDLSEEEMLAITSLTEEEISVLDEEEQQLVYEAKNWIAGAIKHPGALTRAAKRAGESTSEYEHKHEHDSGKAGKRARLALTLKKLNK
jgi:hypothetical protein